MLPKFINRGFFVIILFSLALLVIFPTSIEAISTFSKYSGNPILSPNPESWEGSRLWQNTVVHDGTEFKMYYVGYNGRFQIGLAHSNDGTSWIKDPNNPVISRLGFDNKDSHDPSVLFNGISYEMWYTSSDSGGTTNFAIQRAVSNDGISWTNDPITPVFQPTTGWGAGTITAPFVLRVLINGS